MTRIIWYGAVTTCGGGSHVPSPSLCGKVMLSLAARGVWTGCCRYGNAAGDWSKAEVPATDSENSSLSSQVNNALELGNLFVLYGINTSGNNFLDESVR